MKIKVGSLFDGIGGAPLAAILSGAEPVWASEIEKIPVSITERHFPDMKHYGDVTQINGAEIEPVDLIVGGSPCQDLSVAGKRAGLEGERSGLFMDQIRIVKEMRDATRETNDGSNELPRPRYMVWENVPGAFSSNKGEDFRAVLEEVCRIGEEEVSIPRPPKGKWSKSGSIVGDGYSLAWRTVDAQHWGVPQRRRRIYLVADFGGQSAPEICFEREGVPGDTAESGEAGQGVATDAERSVGATGESGVICSATQQANAERYWNLSPTITASAGKGGGMGPWIAKAYSLQGNMIGRADHNGPQGSGVNEDVNFTLNTVDRHAVCYDGSTVTSPTNAQNPKLGDPCHTLGTDSRNYVCFEPRSQDGVHRIHGDISPTLNTAQGGQRQPCVLTAVEKPTKADEITGMAGNTITATLDASYATKWGLENQHVNAGCPNFIRQPVYAVDRESFSSGQKYDRKPGITEDGVNSTLTAGGPSAVASPEQKYIVRRLTPLECERLQGFPDGWTAEDVDGKTVSDTQRYKALGNSFAMPNAYFFISRIIRELRKENHEP